MNIIRATPAALWNSCSDRFLRVADGRTIARSAAHVWLTHRLQRDRLLEDAVGRGIQGWMPQPFSFFSELPKRFDIQGKPVGLMIRRRMISSIAAAQGKTFGIVTSGDMGVVRGHMLDALIGELLPEGVTTDNLATALETIAGDDFATRRNAWVHAVYTQYLQDLARAGLYDTRSIHALVARAIDNGELRNAIGGADALHIYGLYSLRTRHTLIDALRRQTDVDVMLYLPQNATELDQLGPFEHADVPEVSSGQPQTVRVQPAPDPLRELQWVAAEVKSLLLDASRKNEPHEIAIIARSGREDTRRMCERLEAAGVPFSARVRRTLVEIPAIALILEVFRGAGEGWGYRVLRNVAASSYTRIRIDTRALDVIAGRAMPRTLEEWERAFEQLRSDLEKDGDRDLKRTGLKAERVARDIAKFTDFREMLAPLLAPRSELAWVRAVSQWLRDDPFAIRRSVCRVQNGRYDVVRFDQRGLTRFAALLAEWESVADDGPAMTALAWYRLLRRLLESEEIALSTPSQKGVQVLEAHDAAMVPFAHTFVVHVNDGEFPSRRAVGGVFTEEERAALVAGGLPLEDRALSLAREQALWHAVTSHQNVTASYRTTDPRGTPLLPSMLLPPHDPSNELPRSLEIMHTPVTRDNARQLAIEALSLRGSATSADTALLQQAVINAHAEQLRGAPDRKSIPAESRISPWNGVLRDPYLMGFLADRFHRDHEWSATQLQAYARNPFFYFVDRVLRLRGYDEAEEETTPLEFGSVAHEVLERFYKQYADAGAIPPDASAGAELAAITERVLKERESLGRWLGSKPLWNVTKRSIRAVITGYVTWEIAHMRSSGETPAHVEYVIGGDAGPATIRGKDLRGAIVEMRMNGKIDRIDRTARGEYLVLDYKSSTIPSAGGYQDGALLQTVLYVEALRQTTDMNATTGRYRALKKPDKPKNGALTKVGDKNYVPALAIAFSIPARVRAGIFECIMCESSEIANWDLDRSVTRTAACLSEGTRFDG